MVAWASAQGQSRKLRILVFQHIAVEHPGVFRDFLVEDGIEWDAVELDDGASIPDFEGYDILLAMGGPMDVWEETAYPWLLAEKQRSGTGLARAARFWEFVLGISFWPMRSAAKLGQLQHPRSA